MSRVPYKFTAVRADDDDSGKNVVPYATVNAKNSVGAPANIYTVQIGGTAASSFILDANGEKQIWVEPGIYQFSVAGGDYFSISVANFAVTVVDDLIDPSSSKVPSALAVSQAISDVSSGEFPQGAWNASTNTPALASSVGTAGYWYEVSVAGTTNLNGETGWQVGDKAIFNGTVWTRIPAVGVRSVNGRTGDIVLSRLTFDDAIANIDPLIELGDTVSWDFYDSQNIPGTAESRIVTEIAPGLSSGWDIDGSYIAPIGGGQFARLKSKTPLPVSINPETTLRFANKLRAIDIPVDGTFVGITGYGDSMAGTSYTVANISLTMIGRRGLGGVFTPGLGLTWRGAAWTFSGGANQPFNDFTYFPGANQINLPSGSSAETTVGVVSFSSATITDGSYPAEANLGAIKDFTSVEFYYLKRPGDGTLTITPSQVGETYSATVINCNDSLQLAYFTVDIKNPSIAMTINAAASAGNCVFLGALFKRKSGILFWLSQVGGSTMDQQKVYINNGNVNGVYKDLFDKFNTGLIIHAQRAEGDANWKTNYDQVFSALDSFGATQLILGEPPRFDDATKTPKVSEINYFLRSRAIKNHYPMFDQFLAAGSSNDIISELNWDDGDIHLAAPAWRYFAGKILQEYSFFDLGVTALDFSPLTLKGLIRNRLTLLAMFEARKNTLIGDLTRTTMTSQTASGGYTFSGTDDKGFGLVGAAATGGIVGSIGTCATSSVVRTSTEPYSFAIVGRRNLALVANTRAFVSIGNNSVPANVAAIAERCFGLEFALGTDVGVTGSPEVVRIFYYDGATVNYSAWRPAIPSGAGSPSTEAMSYVLEWSKDSQEIILSAGSGRSGLSRTFAFPSANLAANNCAGALVCMGLHSHGGTPASAANFSIKQLTCMYGSETSIGGYPYNEVSYG